MSSSQSFQHSLMSRQMELPSSPYTSHLVLPLGFALLNEFLYTIAFLGPIYPSRSMAHPILPECSLIFP